MGLTAEDLAALAGLIDSKIEAAVGAATAPEPVAKATTTKATGTAKKAALVRNLDPVDVEAGDGVHSFRVIASNQAGPLTRGARVLPLVDGKVYRSLSVGMIAALAEDGVLSQIAKAIDTVDKRAKLGEHAPAKVAA